MGMHNVFFKTYCVLFAEELDIINDNISCLNFSTQV